MAATLPRRRPLPASRRPLLAAAALMALGACGNGSFDFDLRDSLGDALDTSSAVRQITEQRPAADNRGVISYPGYQVAVARGGDTVSDVAARVGLPAEDLSRHNGVPMGVSLRKGEIIALPRRVEEPSPRTGAAQTGPIRPATVATAQPAPATPRTAIARDPIEVGSLDRPAAPRSSGTTAAPAPAPTPAPTRAPTPAALPSGTEPIRHKVGPGETAYSVSRLYDVPVQALGEWNGLGSDLSVREGQYLLIPVLKPQASAPAPEPAPGAGSVAPVPPSAAKPLPAADVTTAKPKETPPSPDLAKSATPTARSDAPMTFPVTGPIIRPFVKKKNDGIDISSTPGTPVKAAADGEVAAITRDTDQVPILVLRHPGNLLTVYAGLEGISVQKGETVKRGQQIARIRDADPAFLHFEVREGFDSVDPVKYLE